VNRLIKQITGFGIVGVVCFLMDYILMIVMTEQLTIPYLISSAVSFSASTVVNYLLSMRYIFRSKKGIDKKKEFLLFVIMSIVGLGLTVLLMRVLVENFGIHYMLSKIAVTGIVMVYNFVSRKLLLDERNSSSVS